MPKILFRLGVTFLVTLGLLYMITRSGPQSAAPDLTELTAVAAGFTVFAGVMSAWFWTGLNERFDSDLVDAVMLGLVIILAVALGAGTWALADLVVGALVEGGR